MFLGFRGWADAFCGLRFSDLVSALQAFDCGVEISYQSSSLVELSQGLMLFLLIWLETNREGKRDTGIQTETEYE